MVVLSLMDPAPFENGVVFTRGCRTLLNGDQDVHRLRLARSTRYS